MNIATREALEREMESVMGAIRKQMPSEARSLEVLLIARKNLEDAPEGTEYFGYENVIDAIVAHLRKTGYKLTGEEIISAIVRGGGGRSKKAAGTQDDTQRERSPRLNVRDSIRYNLSNCDITRHIRVIGPGDKKPKREAINAAVIGLYEWDDEHP